MPRILCFRIVPAPNPVDWAEARMRMRPTQCIHARSTRAKMKVGQRLANPHFGQPSLWPTFILATTHFDQPSFRPALTLANTHFGQPSLRPTLTLASPHFGQPSLWPALISASPHFGQPSVWPTLTLASLHSGQHSFWPSFTLANPRFIGTNWLNEIPCVLCGWALYNCAGVHKI